MEGVVVIVAFVIIILVFVFFVAMEAGSGDADRRARLEALLKSQSHFAPTQLLSNSRVAVAIDENACLVALATLETEPPQCRIVSYADILGAEVVEDGVAITSASRGDQISRGILAGLAFGTAGAIVGGLSAKTATSHQVNRLELRVVVADTTAPMHVVVLRSSPIDRALPSYQKQRQLADYWQALFRVVIKHGESSGPTKCHEAAPLGSVADEIRKLSVLVDDGILTREEFDAQKARLLS